ncbi:MAG: hypothetical protein ACE5MB_02550 [Anaerolineae bacterium]
MPSETITSAIFALTPSESKRLIARAVAALPEVRRAMEQGRIIIANGTTNAFVAEELLGISVPKYRFAAGIIAEGLLAETRPEDRLPPYVLRNGQPVDVPAKEMIREFEADDVFIKGGNAVDPQGNVGILMANERGGTIGMALGTVVARGAHLIAPVGLEKLVPSVPEAARKCGQLRQKYHLGSPVGLMPLVNARVITEVQALDILAGVQATHVASGGINGSEGAVVLVAEGSEEDVARAFRLVERIKGEPPVRGQGLTTR